MNLLKLKPVARLTWAALSCLIALAVPARPQTTERPATVPVLMVSDIHFEPFWDPAKVRKLAATPISEWEPILAAPDSPDRAARFAAVGQQCGVRGQDTSFPLLQSSLGAMRSAASGAKFITLSGDLIAHKFDCKFRATMPGASDADYRSFVLKTIAFVEFELRRQFPGVPLYAALGNNDSDCGDYQLDPGSWFLAGTGTRMTADVPRADRAAALASFQASGDYSVPLPAPIRGARLLVLDNLFQSVRYRTCGGKTDPAAAADQIAWLRSQLEAARSKHEKIWVMGHIPPGVDPYSTIRKTAKICAGGSPTLFLSSDALGETLAEYGDVIRLAIFAHTHMDEFRLLTPTAAPGNEKPAPPVALKMIPSISPVDGNNPSFVVAQVNPATAELRDYQVIVASNQTGIGAQWTEEYDFDRAYGQPGFNAASLTALIDGFAADPEARTKTSAVYLRYYFAKDASIALKPFWPQYVCALTNRTADAYRACACAK